VELCFYFWAKRSIFWG